MTVNSEGYPDFAPGEKVVLFLSKDDSDVANPNENYYVLTGMIQGKFVADTTSTTERYKMAAPNRDEKIDMSTFNDEIIKELNNAKNTNKK